MLGTFKGYPTLHTPRLQRAWQNLLAALPPLSPAVKLHYVKLLKEERDPSTTQESHTLIKEQKRLLLQNTPLLAGDFFHITLAEKYLNLLTRYDADPNDYDIGALESANKSIVTALSGIKETITHFGSRSQPIAGQLRQVITQLKKDTVLPPDSSFKLEIGSHLLAFFASFIPAAAVAGLTALAIGSVGLALTSSLAWPIGLGLLTLGFVGRYAFKRLDNYFNKKTNAHFSKKHPLDAAAESLEALASRSEKPFYNEAVRQQPVAPSFSAAAAAPKNNIKPAASARSNPTAQVPKSGAAPSPSGR